MQLQKTLDSLLNRSVTSKSSPKSIVREIGSTSGEKLTRKQIDRLQIAIAVALHDLNRSDLDV